MTMMEREADRRGRLSLWCPALGRRLGAAALVVLAMVGLASAGGAGASSASSEVAQAKKYLLVLSDMPKGWKTEKGGTNSGGGYFPGSNQLASCIGVSPSIINENPPAANSPYYENQGGSLEVQDAVNVFPSLNNAQVSEAAVGNTKTPGCMTTVMNTPRIKSQFLAGQKGATIGTITVNPIAAAAYGPNTVGLTMTIPLHSQGVSLPIHVLTIFFLKGRLGEEITFNGYGTTFPASVAKHLVSVAQQRI